MTILSRLSCDDIKQTLAAGATLLDVRNNSEFRSGALREARNIPLAILPLLAHEQLKKDEPILVYCAAGGRSVMAEKILHGLGFTDVTNIGGINSFQHCC